LLSGPHCPGWLAGELILFDAKADKFAPLDRVSVLKDGELIAVELGE